MANVNSPTGFKPVRHYMGGRVPSPNKYRIASALASNIFTGDLVKSTGTTKRIDVAAAGNTVVGVFAGCNYKAADGSVVFSPYWPTGTVTNASAEAEALVYDDPNILFEVQSSGTVVAGDIGAVADMLASTAGSTITGVSGQQLDESTVAASGSATLKIIDVVQRDDNALGANAKLLVLINEHELRAAMTAV